MAIREELFYLAHELHMSQVEMLEVYTNNKIIKILEELQAEIKRQILINPKNSDVLYGHGKGRELACRVIQDKIDALMDEDDGM